MAETPSLPAESSTPKAVKDKRCPFCQQPFTSSSLGRHLDVYIREKNPKPPDGVHDVEAIRKLRQNITRRQPKGAVSRRGTSASVGTPTTVSRRSSAYRETEASAARSPLSRKEGTVARAFPFNTPWEATGVINDLAAREDVASGDDGRDVGEDGAGRGSRPGPPQRSVSRQTLKQQLDTRQQLQDAQDTSRAAELALRELLASFRAAKQQIDVSSTPFDFNPLALDFQALILRCLEPPPTLFASTQYPTPTSWSILPPSQSQFDALQAFFEKEFRRWKIACAAATTAVTEELAYPPSLNLAKTNTKDEVRKAEEAAEEMEQLVYRHLRSTYAVWSGLSQDEREQYWRLELARSVVRKQEEVDKLKEGQRLLRQENANLKGQVEQLTRLQQPREFKITPPSTVFMDEKLLDRLLEEGVVNGKRGVGLNLTDRHSDLNTIVSRAVDRWKDVIVSARSATAGLPAQRSLDTTDLGDPASEKAGLTPAQSACSISQRRDSAQPQQPVFHCRPPQVPHPAPAAAVTAAPTMSHSASTSPTTTALPPPVAAPSAAPSTATHADDNEDESDDDEEMSDQDADADGDADGDTDADADADMDDDPGNYNNAQIPLHPQQQQMAQLDATRMQQTTGGNSNRRGAGMSANDGGVGQGLADLHGRMPNWI